MSKTGPNKGKRGKRCKNSKNKNTSDEKSVLILKEDDCQEYAKVTRMLGDRRVECHLYDGQTKIGIIRNKMRKRQWVNLGDVVLVCKRDFQEDKVDIVHVYNSDDVKRMIKRGHLPSEKKEEVEETFVFEEEKGEEEVVNFDEI
jgi:translation initiation factor 1A